MTATSPPSLPSPSPPCNSPSTPPHPSPRESPPSVTCARASPAPPPTPSWPRRAPPSTPTTAITPTATDDGNIAPLAPLPLTPLQLAFHATESLHEGVTAYGYVRQSVTGPLDTALLGRALARLAARHAMLRMRITS